VFDSGAPRVSVKRGFAAQFTGRLPFAAPRPTAMLGAGKRGGDEAGGGRRNRFSPKEMSWQAMPRAPAAACHGVVADEAGFEPRPEGRGHVPNRRGSTYARRRLWITFLRRFWGEFWGGFLEPIGPGASVRGLFSADRVLLVRWASADLVPFSTFFAFLVRFLPVFVPYFALFSSMSCAYLYVNNYFPARLAWDLHRLHRRGRRGLP